MNTSTIALFYCLYDFGLVYEEWERHHLVRSTRKRIRKTKLTRGEMMFIMTFKPDIPAAIIAPCSSTDKKGCIMRLEPTSKPMLR